MEVVMDTTDCCKHDYYSGNCWSVSIANVDCLLQAFVWVCLEPTVEYSWLNKDQLFSGTDHSNLGSMEMRKVSSIFNWVMRREASWGNRHYGPNVWLNFQDSTDSKHWAGKWDLVQIVVE
jgi:hypothetical protein